MKKSNLRFNMKKLTLLIICTLLLCSCSMNNGYKAENSTALPTANELQQESESIENTQTEETASNIAEPPLTLTVNGSEDIVSLRSAFDAGKSEIALNECTMTRGEIDIFFKLLDSVPTLAVDGIKDNALIQYTPEKSELYITYNISDSIWYRFEYVLDEQARENAYSYIEKNSTVSADSSELLLRTDLSADTSSVNVKYLMQDDFSENAALANKYTEIWIEIDDCLIKVVHMNSNSVSENVSAKEVLSAVYVTNLSPATD